MTRINRALIALALLSVALVQPATHVTARDPSRDGLVVVAEGSSAFYGPGWDGAGWERIRRTQAANHGLSPDQVYDADGWYCVKIGYGIGDILTIRNERTGQTGTCMVADTNAPADNAVWRQRWVLEVSWKCFHELGLDESNDVSVWVQP